MERFKVSVWFNPIEIIVSAKNKNDAKKKAYKKLSKKSALKLADKKQTDVY